MKKLEKREDVVMENNLMSRQKNIIYFLLLWFTFHCYSCSKEDNRNKLIGKYHASKRFDTLVFDLKLVLVLEKEKFLVYQSDSLVNSGTWNVFASEDNYWMEFNSADHKYSHASFSGFDKKIIGFNNTKFLNYDGDGKVYFLKE